MRVWILTGLIGVLFFHTACNDNGVPKDSTDSPDDRQAPADNEVSLPASEEAVKTFVLSSDSRIEWKTVGSDEMAGRFGNFVGKIVLRNGNLVENQGHFITVDLGSAVTEDPDLMEQLKADDPLNTDKFPIARFQIVNAESLGEGKVQVSGVLDFHGVAREISFPANFSLSGKETILDVSAELTLDPGEYELDSNLGESTILVNLNAMPGEPRSLVLQDTTVSGEEERRSMKAKGFGGKGRRMNREEWENMSEEERQERRRQRFAEMDTNKDGNLGRDELPEQAWQFVGRADTNGDEMLSPEEREAFRVQMQAERELRELSGEGPPRGFGGKGRKGGEDRRPR